MSSRELVSAPPSQTSSRRSILPKFHLKEENAKEESRQHQRELGDSRTRDHHKYTSSTSSPRNNRHYPVDPHPFFIASDAMLSPRADVWIFLFLSSCASTASLSASSPAAWRTFAESAALACMGSSTAVSICVAAGFRYRPSRRTLTRPFLFRLLRSTSMTTTTTMLTLELAVAVLTLGLWLVSAGLVFRQSPRGNMAVAQMEIWNTNLFFGSWISTASAAYLVADLITVRNPSGLLPRECSLVMGNAIPRGWALCFVASLALFVFGLGKNGDDGGSAVSAIVFGIVGTLLSLIYLLFTLQERQSNESSNDSQNNSTEQNAGRVMSNMPKGRVVSSLLSVTSLLCFSINVALGTSPPSSSSCNVYFSSWTCFAISLYLCIRHAEAYLVPASAREITTLAQEGHYSADHKDHHLPINKHGIKRVHSKNSVSTASPHSQYSDDDTSADGDTDVIYDHNADEVMTAMAESRSEDGPMLFLPMDGNPASAASEIHDDASYPSMTPNHHHDMHRQYHQYQHQYPQREPHKPRSISPPAVSTTTGRPKRDPTVYAEGHFNSKEDPDGHLQSSGTMLVDDVDTKLQAKVSSSGSESHNRGSDSAGGKGTRQQGRRKNKPSNNPEGTRSTNVSRRTLHVDNKQLPPQVATKKDTVATDENPQVDHGGFFVAETMRSMSSSSSSSDASAVLDGTTTRNPPVVTAPRSSSRHSQRQSGAAKSPRVRRDPSFQESTLRQQRGQQLQQQQQQRSQAAPQVGSVDFEATTTTQDGFASREAPSKSGSGPSSRQRSGSKSKSRSRSGDRSKKRHSREHGEASSSSRKSNPTAIGLRRSSGDNTGINSRGPSAASNDTNSSGAWGQGPATMSASSGGGRSGLSTDSGPLTDEEGMEEMMMGRVGPGRVEAPPVPRGAESDSLTDPGRPMVTVHGTLSDSMSMVSEPTMDGFGPPGEEYNASSSRSQRQRAVPPSSGPPNAGGDAPRYSYADHLSPDQSSSSETNGNNKAMRQGAVDKMVMEALRQAQEARQGGGLGSVGHPPPPPPLATVDLQRHKSQTSKNPSGESKRKKSMSPGRGGKQTSMRSRSSSHSRRSKHGSNSKSPGGSSKPPSFHKQSSTASRPPSSPGRPAGKGGKVPGISAVNSFYSGSDSASPDADDAFAC